MRCELPHLPADALGARSQARHTPAAGIPGTQADPLLRAGLWAEGSRRARPRLPCRLQYHRLRQAGDAQARSGLGPARRRSPAHAARGRVPVYLRCRRRNALRRRAHRRHAGPVAALISPETGRIMGKVFRVEYPIRFSHCDPAGQVYFPRFFDLLHDAMEDWFNNGLQQRFADFLMNQKLGTPTVGTQCAFLSPPRFGDTLVIELSLLRPANSSTDL